MSIGANVAGTGRRKVHRGTAAFSVFLMHLAGGRMCFSTFEPRGGDWCTRITRVRRSAVVARRGLEATTLLPVAGGAGGRELLPRCYQTIPNDADLRRTPSIPGVPVLIFATTLLPPSSSSRSGAPDALLVPCTDRFRRAEGSRLKFCPPPLWTSLAQRLPRPVSFSRVETYRSLSGTPSASSGRARFETK